jgi:hypothetical protein
MASNDGRVQTQELNLFQPIQPAPLPGSTYVTPQAPRVTTPSCRSLTRSLR